MVELHGKNDRGDFGNLIPWVELPEHDILNPEAISFDETVSNRSGCHRLAISAR